MKRKSNPCAPGASSTPPLSLTSFDAALDLLACDFFTRLHTLTSRFEIAAGCKLNDGVVWKRWEEAVKRYEVIRSIDELCCGSKSQSRGTDEGNGEQNGGEVKMDEGDKPQTRKSLSRPLPDNTHPGAVVSFDLCPDEEAQWRKWTPRLNDVVLVELPDGAKWPGKIIDKKVFFQGRTVPRGNHFFPVRLYDEKLQSTITTKSRMIPLHLRSTPPLMASPKLQGAYHHAANPTTFDMLASAKESGEAHNRTHPGAGDDGDLERWKVEKEAWKKTVTWVMGERRLEKIRAVDEERERRLREVSKCGEGEDQSKEANGVGRGTGWAGLKVTEEDPWDCIKKRRVEVSAPCSSWSSQCSVSNGNSKSVNKIMTDNCDTDRGGIFRISSTPASDTSTSTKEAISVTPQLPTPLRVGSPFSAPHIRPLASPLRPVSPRRLAGRRGSSGFLGTGEFSPLSRGGTYTPPRVTSGDERAASGSPVPSLKNFDFVSPLGPVRFGKLHPADEDGDIGMNGPAKTRSESFTSLTLPVVKEEVEEGDETVEGWTTVQRGRKGRAESAPCREKGHLDRGNDVDVASNGSVLVVAGDSMEL